MPAMTASIAILVIAVVPVLPLLPVLPVEVTSAPAPTTTPALFVPLVVVLRR